MKKRLIILVYLKCTASQRSLEKIVDPGVVLHNE